MLGRIALSASATKPADGRLERALLVLSTASRLWCIFKSNSAPAPSCSPRTHLHPHFTVVVPTPLVPSPARSSQPPADDLHWAHRPRISFRLAAQKETPRGPWTVLAEHRGAALSHLAHLILHSQPSHDPHSAGTRPHLPIRNVASYRPLLLDSSSAHTSPHTLSHSSSIATLHNCTFDTSLVEDAFGCGRRRLFIHSDSLLDIDFGPRAARSSSAAVSPPVKAKQQPARSTSDALSKTRNIDAAAVTTQTPRLESLLQTR